MSADVIQYHAAHRKRRNAPSWVARRIDLVIAAGIGIIAASLLAMNLAPSPPPPTPRALTAPAPTPTLPSEAAPVEIDADLASPPRRRAPPAALHPGIPLDAAVPAPSDDIEILSAAELARISQARD